MAIHIEVSSKAGTEKLQFEAPSISIGRHPTNDLAFPPEEELIVSSFHARVALEGGRLFLEDAGSRNGTYVNGQRIAGRVQVGPEDEVTLGTAGPRLRIQRAIPQTIVEIPGTLAQKVDLSELLPPDESSEPPSGGSASPPGGEGVQARSAVGTMTVMRMIDHALEKSRGSGKLMRQTVFIQEIVKLAVKESNRTLRITVAALVAVLAVVFGFVFYRIATVRSEMKAVKAELSTTIDRGWSGVEQKLRTTQREMEQQRALYDGAAAVLQKQLDRTISDAARRDSKVAALASQLADSRLRLTELTRQLESKALGSAGPAPQPPLEQEQRREIANELRQEQEKQRDLYSLLASAAGAGAGAAGAKESIPQIGAQIMAADSSKAQIDARLDKLKADLTSVTEGRQQKTEAATAAIAGGDTAALLDTLSSMDRALAPQVASVSPGLPEAASPIVARTSQQRYTRPFPRGNVKKRLAVGRFEYVAASNPWNAAPRDIEKMLRAQMTTLLRDTGQFVIVEREDLNEVLEEQQLGRTGVAGQSAAGAGQVLGAQGLLIGKITQVSEVVENRKSSMNWGAMLGSIASVAGAAAPTSDFANISNELASNPTLGSLQTSNQNRTSTFTIHIDFKILDTRTGEVIFTAPGHGVAKSVTKVSVVSSLTGSGGSVIGGDDNVSDATRLALYDAVTKIMEGMEKVGWRGRIMDRAGDRIVINGGGDAGLQAGDTFQVLSRGKELIDPESGQTRGHIETAAGVVRITSVHDLRSEAEVLEQTLAFKTGDDLLYLGSTKPLGPGETESSVEEPQPVRYAVMAAPLAYSGPGSNFAPVKLQDLEAGTPVRVKLALGDWAKVVLPGGSHAWMAKGNLAFHEEPANAVRQVVVQAKKAALRTVPSSKSRRLEVIPNGVAAKVHEKLGGWYLIDSPKGVRGWVKEGEVRQSADAAANEPARAGA